MMIITAEIDNKVYKFASDKEIDISIPVRFDEKQLKAFGAEPAQSLFYAGDDFTVSVESGAGCNCSVFTFSAHLHGTHTECVGHISKAPYVIQDITKPEQYIISTLISVQPEPAENCSESYSPDFKKDDLVITKKMLQQKNLKNTDALIIRTLPNTTKKKIQNYDENVPSFFTNEAMQFICSLGVQHLLVDIPSVDRLEDDGRLSNHHIFWDVVQGTHDVVEPSNKTITEFIYVPDTVKDGEYILSLNIGNIRSDAAPSRPVLYEVIS